MVVTQPDIQPFTTMPSQTRAVLATRGPIVVCDRQEPVSLQVNLRLDGVLENR
jgi:hypothetical protein